MASTRGNNSSFILVSGIYVICVGVPKPMISCSVFLTISESLVFCVCMVTSNFSSALIIVRSSFLKILLLRKSFEICTDLSYPLKSS